MSASLGIRVYLGAVLREAAGGRTAGDKSNRTGEGLNSRLHDALYTCTETGIK